MDHPSSFEPVDGEPEGQTLIRVLPQARPDRAGWVHSLVITDGDLPARRQLLGSEPLQIGRRAPCGLVLADQAVSGLHCEVQVQPAYDALLFKDLGSTNGSFIDGRRILGQTRWPPGAVLSIGRFAVRHEYGPRHELVQSQELERDLQKASHYVQSLLPAPLKTGPIRADWLFQPSARVGGDAFGYLALGEGRFAGYVIDVAGHGAGSAMHAVSVINVLRQKALPETDFARPAQVLQRLNSMFPMEDHAGMYFTIWYGVFDSGTRVLEFASGGHHPAYLTDPERTQMQPLRTRGLPIGAVPHAAYTSDQTHVAEGSHLYIFSDGVYEITTAQGTLWGLPDFLPLILQAEVPGVEEPARLFAAVRQAARPGPLDDDFSALVVTFL